MNQQFYQVGGTLPANAQSYIKRDADIQLYNYLKEGKYCYVLNARQVGKSSLRVHTSKRLEDEGYICVNIDLTSIGSEGITADEWYFSFILYIVEELGLDEDEFVDWWDVNNKITVVNRFAKTFDKFVLKSTTKKIVIFIDEIDAILGIDKFSIDNFFAVIRTFYNLRSEDECYDRLSFVLFGVATPKDLMKDSSRTPFNIAHNVEIKQFVLTESSKLMDGLDNQVIDKNLILEKIFEWTSGTPYLTQKLLYFIANHPIKSLSDIDKIVNDLFIRENFKETNLSNIQNRILSNELYNLQMLYLIKKLQNNMTVNMNNCDLTCVYLKLSGLAKETNGKLQYRNKIYETIFNNTWIEHMIAKIDKPFALDLKKWLDYDKCNSCLIKGKALKEAKDWARNNQVNNIESEYLRHSSHSDNNKKLLIVLSIFLLSIGVFFLYYEKSIVDIKEKGCQKSCKIDTYKKQFDDKKTFYLQSIQGNSYIIKKEKQNFIFDKYKDKIIILVVFGKDCVYCQKELTVLNKINEKYNKKIQIIIIQAQDRMNLKEANNIIKKYQINYPIIEGDDSKDFLSFLVNTYGWTGILPYTLIIKNGITEFTYSGETSYSELERDILSI